jgi:hypothetical protein
MSPTVNSSNRANCAAHSEPTPARELTGAGSGKNLIFGGDIGRTIQIAQSRFNGKAALQQRGFMFS